MLPAPPALCRDPLEMLTSSTDHRSLLVLEAKAQDSGLGQEARTVWRSWRQTPGTGPKVVAGAGMSRSGQAIKLWTQSTTG